MMTFAHMRTDILRVGGDDIASLDGITERLGLFVLDVGEFQQFLIGVPFDVGNTAGLRIGTCEICRLRHGPVAARSSEIPPGIASTACAGKHDGCYDGDDDRCTLATAFRLSTTDRTVRGGSWNVVGGDVVLFQSQAGGCLRICLLRRHDGGFVRVFRIELSCTIVVLTHRRCWGSGR